MVVRPLLACLTVGVLALAAPAPSRAQGDSLGADWRQQQNEARQRVVDGRHVPLDKVIASIARTTPGRLLDTGIEPGQDGRSVYRVRWAAADGRRIDFIIEAATGQVIRTEGR